MDAVQNLSLDACLSRSESASIINDVRGDLEKALVGFSVIIYYL